MYPEALTRTFKATESNYPYIIPALRNGMTVEVTAKIAREFRLAKVGIMVKGTIRYIKFTKTELGLWEMKLEEN